MVWIWIIIVLVWVIGIFASYDMVFKHWTDSAKWETVWYSVIWPLVAILYGFRWISMKL